MLTGGKLWWNLSTDLICKELDTDPNLGLSSEAAREKLERFGLNQLPESVRPSAFKLFFDQFASFIVWMLMIAAAMAGILGEWIDASAIFTIVILNAIIGFVQEFNAERSLEALKKMAAPVCKVVRNGILQTIPCKEAVPGDLILLEAGDLVPVDGRIIQSVQLSTQEASLTGESMPVFKTDEPMALAELPIGDRRNMAFMGTVALSGRGHMLATATGLNTELGKIASLLGESKKEQTPLQIRLRQLGRRLVFLCLGTVLIVFILGILRGNSWMGVLLTATSLAVAAVPEGLPAIVTVALAAGVRKMARRKALIRRLSSVETLGCATVICTDKTGTLTQNEMAVRKLWAGRDRIDVPGGSAVLSAERPELKRLLEIGVLCNNASVAHSDQGWRITGDPTEGALIVAAEKGGIKKREREAQNPLLGEIPFDSERKRMSVLRKTPDGTVLFVKGAPDIILDRCQTVFLNGQKTVLTSFLRQEILDAVHDFGMQALRVLGMAYRDVESGRSIDASMEDGLTFAGLMAMMDPPRPEAKEAVQTCMGAGILPVMITGDHQDTAKAVARELGLTDERGRVIGGTELQRMDDGELKKSIRDIRVYARVSAEDKLRIVRMWRSLGEIVAVTGDGVNDAPAIKEADIGIAMGIKGTDVAKEAADMVITDDHFASIVNAVEEGRGIYDNILKFVNYLLSSNIAELIVIFIGMAAGFRDPAGNLFVSLSAIQLLFLNLVTDGFPAIALGLDPIDPKAMDRPPRKPDEPILSFRTALQLISVSAVIAAGALIACHFGLRTSAALGQTMTLTALVVMELVRVQMVRAQYHIGFFSNRWMGATLLGSLLVQLTVVYFPPFQRVFGTVGLNIQEWGVIALAVAGAGVGAYAIQRIFRQRKAVFAALILFAAPLFSEEDPLIGSPLPLETLVGEVLKRNPDLEAARERIRAAAETVHRVQVIDDPEFRFMSDYNNFKSGSEFLPMLQYQISQTFPFPGKLGLRGKVAAEALKQFQSQEIATRRDLIYQTKKLYYQLFFNRASDRINQNNRELLKNLIDDSLALYRSGAAGYEEVAKGQVELQVLDEQSLAIEADRIFIVSFLNALLDRPQKDPLGRPLEDFILSQTDFSYENLERTAIQKRPELQELRAMAEEQQLTARLAKREYFPDIVISGGYEQMTRHPRDNAWEASVGFKIPLWAGLRQGRQVREALARASASTNALRGMEAAVRGQIREILGKLKANEERILLYETGLLPKIQEALKAYEAGYRAGKGGFIVLLDTRRQYQDISLEYERARAERESLMAELERAVGASREEMQ